MRHVRLAAALAAMAVAGSGCGRELKPFETRLAALERGDDPLLIYSDLLEVRLVRQCVTPPEETDLPEPLPPTPGAFPRPVYPRGLCTETQPRFLWLESRSPAPPYDLVVSQTDSGAGDVQVAKEQTPATSLASPVKLERKKSYAWSVFMQGATGAARATFDVVDEETAKEVRDAADLFESAIKDRPARLLLQANLFEIRHCFGDAALRILELMRLYPQSTYLKRRGARLSLYAH